MPAKPPRKNVQASSLKNLPQYRDLSDEELERVRARVIEGSTEYRVEEVLKKFGEDYDLSEMNANDSLELRNLAQLYVRLNDIEKELDEQMLDISDPMTVSKLVDISNKLRRDVAVIQENLAITRKARKSDKEEDLVTYIEDLKKRATKFMSERLSYIYCEKCKMLLANTWFLYPDVNNAIKLTCNRVLDEDTGKVCGHVTTITSRELAENGNKNLKDIIRT